MLFVISCIKVLDTPDFSVLFVVPTEHSYYDSKVIFYYTNVENGLPNYTVCKTGYTWAPPAGALQSCLNPTWIYMLMCAILNASN